MKKQAAFLAALVICLGAAEPWESKPFTDWTDDEVQGVISNSPWAHEITISDTYSQLGSSGGGGGRRGGGGGGGFNGVSESAPRMVLVVLWQSALPVRQALVRLKYGAEVAASPAAKEFLERPETYYELVVTGLPASVTRGDPEKNKEAIRKKTALRIKGKAPIPPVQIEVTANGQAAIADFEFPKTTPITSEDNEVEFSTRIADTTVNRKFRLKDMLFHGNLEL